MGYVWRMALEYCEDRELAGHTDWRLPNVRELQSLVDYGRPDLPFDPIFGTELYWYWSSSTYVNDPNLAWVVGFHNGVVGNAHKDTFYVVRPVRG